MIHNSLLLGVHISISGGFEKSLERAHSIGCTCMQIFTKSNQQWHSKPISSQNAQLFIAAQKTYSPIKVIIAHASYLLNIGSSDKRIKYQSRTGLREELERCATLHIPYLVLHPGSAINLSAQECINNIAESINIVFDEFKGNVILLLENTAGQGNSIGYTFDQLKEIYDHVQQKERIGFCLDTCHLFAAGYDIRTEQTYHKTMETLDQLLGIKNLKVIHLNDSKKELGSRVDRHEDIGKGKIGLTGFSLICNDEKLAHIPKILETPKESLIDDKRNMETILKLLK